MLPIAGLRRWQGTDQLSLDDVARELAGLLERPDGWTRERQVRTLDELLRRGRAILLIDGVDQVPGGLGRLGAMLTLQSHSLRIVLACREEVWSPASCPELRVARVTAVDTSAATDEQLPPAIRAALEASLPGDLEHPFWIHVARYLHLHGRLASGAGLTAMLGAYLRQLLRLGLRHQGRDPSIGDLAQVAQEDAARNLLCALALDSLASCLADGPHALGLVPETLVRRSLLRHPEWPSMFAPGALELADVDSGMLRRVSFTSTEGQTTVRVFHHQLLQEYLAASAVRTKMDRALGQGNRAAARDCLLAQAAAIVAPTGDGQPTAEINDRVAGLRLWSFLADLFSADDSPLRPSFRRWLRGRVVGDTLLPAGPAGRRGSRLVRGCLVGAGRVAACVVAAGPASQRGFRRERGTEKNSVPSSRELSRITLV